MKTNQINIAILGLLGLLLLQACGNHPENSFPVPAKISETLTDKHVRIKGSKLYILPADGYKPVESLVRYQKNDTTYLQVVEIPNTSFELYKGNLNRQALESKGAKVDLDTEINYNGYDAFYFEGPSKTDGETKIGLFFGDSTFVTMIAGVCRTTDLKGKKELIDMFKSSYYKKDFDLNPLELSHFNFDLSITGFKFATSQSNILIYTPDGKTETQSTSLNSTIELMPMKNIAFDKLKELLNTITSRYDPKYMKLSDIIKKDTTLNNYQAYQITFNGKDSADKPFNGYEIALQSDTSGMIFIGIDCDNGKYIEKLRQTAQSIKL